MVGSRYAWEGLVALLAGCDECCVAPRSFTADRVLAIALRLDAFRRLRSGVGRGAMRTVRVLRAASCPSLRSVPL